MSNASGRSSFLSFVLLLALAESALIGLHPGTKAEVEWRALALALSLCGAWASSNLIARGHEKAWGHWWMEGLRVVFGLSCIVLVVAFWPVILSVFVWLGRLLQ